MVSFTCNHCQDVVKKPKVQNHANSCGSHSFTCVDCMHVFDLDTIKGHTSCVTEEDKYQGKWKQKLNNNNNSSGGGDIPRGIERPPRAPMNDLSSSDDEDEDWVKKTSSKKSKTEPRVAKPTAAAKSRKHPRPGVSPSSDDDDDDVDDHHRGGQHKTETSTMSGAKSHGASSAEVAVAPATKKPKTTTRSPSATPKTRPAAAKAVQSPPSTSLGPKVSKPPTPARDHHHSNGDDASAEAVQMLKKDTPLLLPRSTTSTECIVPSFVLGTSEEVADIVRDVLAEKGASSMRSKDVAVELVERYVKRIAKSVRHAVDTAAELGALQMDKKGNVSVA